MTRTALTSLRRVALGGTFAVLMLALATPSVLAQPDTSAAAPVGSAPQAGFLTPASPFGRLDNLQSTAAAFRFARPGEATTRVYVWGAVRVPGLYEIGQRTDLSALLALAGGPASTPISREVEQRTVVRLYRTEGLTARRLVYEGTTDAFIVGQGTVGGVPPIPQDGDVVEVTVYTDRIRTWRDDLAVVGGVSAIVIAVTQVVSLFVR